MLVAAYTKTGNLVQAQSLLNAMPVMDAQDQQFKDIQTINIQRAANPQISLSAGQEAPVRAIANDYFSPNAGYAQALMALYFGEYITPELPDLDDFVPSSSKTALPRRKPAYRGRR